MPTYEYRCPSCGREFERFQRMSDPPGAPCPDCGKAAERLISGGGGLLFKGEGFYITDYRSDAYKEKAKQDSGDGTGKKSGDGAGKDERGKDGGGKDRPAKDGAGKTSKGAGKASKDSGAGSGGD